MISKRSARWPRIRRRRISASGSARTTERIVVPAASPKVSAITPQSEGEVRIFAYSSMVRPLPVAAVMLVPNVIRIG